MSSFTRLAAHQCMHGTLFHVCRGSVLDYVSEEGAIVNAANEGCVNGGGVDGALNDMAGPSLLAARQELPFREASSEVYTVLEDIGPKARVRRGQVQNVSIES